MIPMRWPAIALALSLMVAPLTPAQAPIAPPVATVYPAEHWNVFLPERRPLYMAIDHWVVTRYNQGNYQEILDALNSFLPYPGNDPAKILATMYIYWSRRWELAPLLISTLSPAISSSTVRFNALCCFHYALEDTGALHFTSADRAIIEAYVQSGLGTQCCYSHLANSILATMIQLGL